MVSEIVKYRNRYDDEFEFKELSNGNIQWSGNFEYCRFGMPNDYSKAWEVFKEEYGGLDYEEFVDAIHTYDEETNSYVFADLLPLVESKKDVINMVDPSGGPYISEGMNMKTFDLKGIVKEFKSNKNGYEIIVEK
ncbi:hypothetical protein N9H35_00275 [bacterium]|nr:hypothetical protein [bacterium]